METTKFDIAPVGTEQGIRVLSSAVRVTVLNIFVEHYLSTRRSGDVVRIGGIAPRASGASWLSVNDVVRRLQLPQSTTSWHIIVLAGKGLVCKEQGRGHLGRYRLCAREFCRLFGGTAGPVKAP